MNKQSGSITEMSTGQSVTTLPKGEKLLASAFALKNDIEGGFIRLAHVLKQIRDSKAWSSHYVSFDNPAEHNFITDLGMKKSTVNRLILIYEKYIITGGIAEHTLIEHGVGKLGETIPFIETKEDAEHMLSIVQASPTQSILRSRLREEKTGVRQEDCSHHNSYELVICSDCGYRERPQS